MKNLTEQLERILRERGVSQIDAEHILIDFAETSAPIIKEVEEASQWSAKLMTAKEQALRSLHEDRVELRAQIEKLKRENADLAKELAQQQINSQTAIAKDIESLRAELNCLRGVGAREESLRESVSDLKKREHLLTEAVSVLCRLIGEIKI